MRFFRYYLGARDFGNAETSLINSLSTTYNLCNSQKRELDFKETRKRRRIGAGVSLNRTTRTPNEFEDRLRVQEEDEHSLMTRTESRRGSQC